MIRHILRRLLAALSLTIVLLIWWQQGPKFLTPTSRSIATASAEEAAFIAEASEVEFALPFSPAPLRELCTAREFRPGLLFTCDWVTGGIGNVRNHILNCVRYAIEGGGALVVPGIVERSHADIADIYTTDREEFDYLLDRDVFKTRLADCPGLQVFDDVHDFPNYTRRGAREDSQTPIINLVAGSFQTTPQPAEGLANPEQWRAELDHFIAQHGIREFSGEKPLHIRLQRSYLEYPVYKDGERFVEEFGKVLSFRRDARELSAAALWQLGSRFGLNIRPGQFINDNAYYGTHLRLESDAVKAWPAGDWRFSRYEEQLAEQVQGFAQRPNLSVIYVACGNQTIVEQFEADITTKIREISPDRNVTVLTKHDLLTGKQLARLERLTFDQQALVDFLVMVKSSFFMGVAHSSFAWNVALRRHELSMFRGNEVGNEGSDLLHDEFSIIMGMKKDYPVMEEYEFVMWP